MNYLNIFKKYYLLLNIGILETIGVISICVTSSKANKTYTFSTIVAFTGMSAIKIAN